VPADAIVKAALRGRWPAPLRRTILFCVIVIGALFCVGQLLAWWAGEAFPGTQFFYSSKCAQPRIFRLTADNSDEVVLVRIAPDYVESLIPGAHGGYAFVDLTAYLPDMVPADVYDARDPLAAKADQSIPEEQLLKRLGITLGQSTAGPDDPTGEIGYVEDQVDEIEKDDRKLGNNRFSQYDAYIWTETGGDMIDGQSDTQTYYVPKDKRPFYISCRGEGGPYAACSILFVVNSLVAVDVDIAPKKIAQAANIMQKVSLFLEPKVDQPRPYCASRSLRGN